MSIHDRPYARDNKPTQMWSNGRARSFNTVLIVVNIAIFLLGMFSRDLAIWIGNFGHFSTTMLLPPKLEFWRLISFQFLHASPLHIVMNMLGLYMFGRIVEEHLGRSRYLAFYIVCGVCGGLMYFLLNAIGQYARIPGVLIHDPSTRLVGASAGVFGVMMACAFLEPDTKVIAFPVPVPIKMRTLVYVYLGISIAMLFMGTANAGGEAAHIGGAIAGFFFIRRIHLLRDFFDVFSNSRKKTRPSPLTVAEHGRDECEIDRILAKVTDHGLHSLTEKERAMLKTDTDRRRNAG